MIHRKTCFAGMAACLLLAGCNDSAPTPAEEAARNASGEVLEASLSDAMIPLEQTRSNPPIEAPVVTSPASDTPGEAADEASADAADAAAEPGQAAD